jgi:hypothetical protein
VGEAVGSVLDVLVVGPGLGLLIGLAVLIGQAQAQDAAWRRIAAERRELHEREDELVRSTGRGRCADCPLRRERGEP